MSDGSSAAFVRAVSQTYTIATLQRLAQTAVRPARRGGVLALSFLGAGESIACMGRALRDPDRAVRLITEDGIRAVWSRAGSIDQCQRLRLVTRHNAAGDHDRALRVAAAVLAENPGFSEVWYQCTVAHYGQGDFDAAIASGQQALESNSFHFPAALALGQCFLALSDTASAISCFQWALEIHPHLESARTQIRRLERDLGKHLDH